MAVQARLTHTDVTPAEDVRPDPAADPARYGLVQLGRKQPLGEYLRDLWDHRELARSIPATEFRAENTETVLGNVWHVLDPLVHVAVFWLIFGQILGTDRGIDNFLLYLAAGMFTFFYTKKSVLSGARAITSNEKMVRSISFPRAILPIAAVSSKLLALGPALVIVFSIALFTGERPDPSWLTIPFAFAMLTAFNMGIAFVLARVSDHFPDIQNILPYMLRIWMYLSGVFYAFEGRFGDRVVYGVNAAKVALANPMVHFLSAVRTPLLEHRVAPWYTWAAVIGVGTLTLVGGFLFFRQREHHYGRG
ncbi:MAG: ABC transporter permease [Actinomycetota bacterium]|nr:ABC transporter permease [Actinomycetota bacterium]